MNQKTMVFINFNFFINFYLEKSLDKSKIDDLELN